MQRLARGGCLDRVDYLSTVSGGGYIGGALTWFANSGTTPALGTGAKNFPHGVADPRQGRRSRDSGILDHLRLHGKYITPGRGITATALIAVILRGLLLNLLVWMPLATGVLMVLLCIDDGKTPLRWLLWLGALLGGVFLGLSILYSLGTRLPGVKGRYELRRFFEKGIRWVLWFGLVALVLGSLPVLSKAFVSLASVLLGLAGGGLSFLRSSSRVEGGVRLGLIAPAARSCCCTDCCSSPISSPGS